MRSRIELNPLRAFDSDHAGTRAVMEKRAAAARPPRPTTTPSTSREVRALLDVAGVAYEVDSTLVRGLDYYTRTVFEFTSDALGAQSGVGGGGRYDGLVERARRPGDARAWAGPRASSGSCSPATRAAGRARPVELFVALEDRSGGTRGRLRPARAGALGGTAAQMELAGRSLKGQLGHANSLGARYVAIVDGSADGAQGHAGGRAGADRDRHRRARGAARPRTPLRALPEGGAGTRRAAGGRARRGLVQGCDPPFNFRPRNAEKGGNDADLPPVPDRAGRRWSCSRQCGSSPSGHSRPAPARGSSASSSAPSASSQPSSGSSSAPPATSTTAPHPASKA